MPWLLIGGGALVLIVFLRSNSQASNIVNQTYTKPAGTMVPFPNAGSASAPTATAPFLVGAKQVTEAVGNWNPRAVNGNGQPVTPPSANVINAGSQTAVINQNIANAQAAAVQHQSTWWYKDPVSGTDYLGSITYAVSGSAKSTVRHYHWIAFANGSMVTQGNT